MSPIGHLFRGEPATPRAPARRRASGRTRADATPTPTHYPLFAGSNAAK